MKKTIETKKRKPPAERRDEILAAASRLAVAEGLERLTLRRLAERRLPTALLLGAEGPGLSTAALGSVDAVVTIPMAVGVDSLNVATATAVALERLSGI